MNEKIINLLKQREFIIPATLFINYKKLKLEEKELIVLIYLLNENDITFNPQKISKMLNIEVKEILEIISNLSNKDFLKIQINREKNIHEEYIDLEGLYNKLALFVMTNEEDHDKDSSSVIFDSFEREFGRPLSPIEYELINGWQSSKITDELIELALKEAVYNGALSLRYIDRILFDWSKKGIKNKEDVEKSRLKFQSNRKPTVFNYDWLNDENKN